jgi:uncharacterized RDD family membrane protein YckC
MNQPPDPGTGVPEPESLPHPDAAPAASPLSDTPPAAPPLPTAPPPPAEGTDQGYGVTAAPPGMYYDSESGLTLPQGVQLAGHGRRIGAYFLAIPLAIGTLVIGYIIWGLIVWSRGQTPALQVLGMRCWRPETRRVPGFWWMALREIIGRLVDGILGIITQLTSFILFLTTRERKALHDYIAGTVVLHDPDKVLDSWTAGSS